MMNSSGGKGSATRPTLATKETFSSNWDKIFSKQNDSNESKLNSSTEQLNTDKNKQLDQ